MFYKFQNPNFKLPINSKLQIPILKPVFLLLQSVLRVSPQSKKSMYIRLIRVFRVLFIVFHNLLSRLIYIFKKYLTLLFFKKQMIHQIYNVYIEDLLFLTFNI